METSKLNLESSQGEKKGSELNVNAGFTIIDNNFPKHRDSEDLSEVQFNQNENTGGMGSCLSVAPGGLVSLLVPSLHPLAFSSPGESP